jgi:hypothetical protein
MRKGLLEDASALLANAVADSLRPGFWLEGCFAAAAGGHHRAESSATLSAF